MTRESVIEVLRRSYYPLSSSEITKRIWNNLSPHEFTVKRSRVVEILKSEERWGNVIRRSRSGSETLWEASR